MEVCAMAVDAKAESGPSRPEHGWPELVVMARRVYEKVLRSPAWVANQDSQVLKLRLQTARYILTLDARSQKGAAEPAGGGVKDDH